MTSAPDFALPNCIIVEVDRTWRFATVDLDSLEALQAVVDGPIEVVDLPQWGDLLIVNEEGKYGHRPRINRLADILAQPVLRPGDCIVGTAIVVGTADGDFIEGNLDYWADRLTAAAAALDAAGVAH